MIDIKNARFREYPSLTILHRHDTTERVIFCNNEMRGWIRFFVPHWHANNLVAIYPPWPQKAHNPIEESGLTHDYELTQKEYFKLISDCESWIERYFEPQNGIMSTLSRSPIMDGIPSDDDLDNLKAFQTILKNDERNIDWDTDSVIFRFTPDIPAIYLQDRIVGLY